MHNFVLKIFNSFREMVKGLKIITIFLIMMLCLYWTQNLIGAHWEWMDFVKPVMEAFVNAGEKINDGSIMLFEAVFEFKYFIALLLFLVVYAFLHLCYLIANVFEKSYNFGRTEYKKREEMAFNTQMQMWQSQQQRKIQSYYVYIKANVKRSQFVKVNSINLDEQEMLMNKFIMEQTSTAPVKFEGGFLYEFSCFDRIDAVLSVFFRVLRSSAPLDYQICVLIREGNKEVEQEKVKQLISLGFINKISTLANVVYRYGFIENSKYTTALLGLFQKGNNTFEIHEFVDGI